MKIVEALYKYIVATFNLIFESINLIFESINVLLILGSIVILTLTFLMVMANLGILNLPLLVP